MYVILSCPKEVFDFGPVHNMFNGAVGTFLMVSSKCGHSFARAGIEEVFTIIGVGDRGAGGAAALPTLEKLSKISYNRAEDRHKVGQNLRKQWIFYRAAPLNFTSPYAYVYHDPSLFNKPCTKSCGKKLSDALFSPCRYSFFHLWKTNFVPTIQH